MLALTLVANRDGLLIVVVICAELLPEISTVCSGILSVVEWLLATVDGSGIDVSGAGAVSAHLILFSKTTVVHCGVLP